ncbi:hypothetical protein KXD97_26650 [Mycobacterium sp. SMC-8]|uniref:DUF7065 domain-containing protein n=1 Tax=Mycobacterium sp. SMC-8 TaxID=2857060 RepID=UPI0021B1C162|nr:hypothetical protein [Mycobacterium sp. SMC-8]UXA11542.1 hypothetical protein KXD97_26650 [Mycobacterium sp. SMC-8]
MQTGDSTNTDKADVFTAEDDAPHAPDPDFYFTETYWYSFFAPDRDLGGWLYAGIRPHAGVTLGGCWIWDPSGTDPWEIPFYEQYHWLKLPTGTAAGIAFPTGMTVRTIEPTTAYQLGYTDRDRLEVDLRFDAVEPPVPLRAGTPPYPKASHFDQTGRVVGHLVLDGERIDIDCYAMRDRSWGGRRERGFHPMGYTWMASEQWSALLYSRPAKGHDHDEVYAGYVRRADTVSYVRSGTRTVERDPANGWITGMRLEVQDEAGGVLNFDGVAKSRMILPGATNVCVNTALTFAAADGMAIHGEDQDVWPISKWRKLSR